MEFNEFIAKSAAEEVAFRQVAQDQLSKIVQNQEDLAEQISNLAEQIEETVERIVDEFRADYGIERD